MKKSIKNRNTYKMIENHLKLFSDAMERQERFDYSELKMFLDTMKKKINKSHKFFKKLTEN